MHVMSCSLKVSISPLGGAPDAVYMKSSLEIHLSSFPQQSQDASENSSGTLSHVTYQLLLWIYLSLDFRPQKLMVFSNLVVS